MDVSLINDSGYVRSKKETLMLYIILFISFITSSISIGYGKTCVLTNTNVDIMEKEVCFYTLTIGWLILLYSFAMFFICKNLMRNIISRVINNVIMYISTFGIFYCTGFELCRENVIQGHPESIIIIVIGMTITITSFTIINCLKPIPQHSYT
jgi:hypothetical protein